MASRLATAVLLAAFVSALSACATPLEKSNRFVYQFNETVDKAVFRPTVGLYVCATPRTARMGVSNFFDNLSQPNVILNDFLQGKGQQGFNDLVRFITNSTVGIAGILDVASHIGLEKHDEDFGQTLGVWGVGEGAYLVLPILGPTTTRDVFLFPVRALTNPLTYVGGSDSTLALRILSAADERHRASDDLEARDESAVDPYVFTREAYLQRRRFLVYDGNPPTSDYMDELDDLLDEAAEP